VGVNFSSEQCSGIELAGVLWETNSYWTGRWGKKLSARGNTLKEVGVEERAQGSFALRMVQPFSKGAWLNIRFRLSMTSAKKKKRNTVRRPQEKPRGVSCARERA